MIRLCVLDNGGLETLGVLDVDGLDVGVELLLGALLIVTLARDADTEAEGNTLDTTLPDLLVQLGVEADVASALDGGENESASELVWKRCRMCLRRRIASEKLCTARKTHKQTEKRRVELTMADSAKALISLMARGARFLKETP